MTNLPTAPREAPVIPKPQKREIAIPGAPKKEKKGNIRGGLLILGLLLIAGAVFGFWFILQSFDQRFQVLVTSRTLNRWQISSAADFTVVQANPGDASFLTANQLGAVVGRWATGTIPAGTIVTAGMFQQPPLSGETEANNVLIQLSLKASEAPFGTLQAGDRVALFGEIASETGPSGLQLLGIITLDFVQGDTITYIVSPEEAWRYQTILEQFESASNRKIWKLGTSVSDSMVEELVGRFSSFDLEDVFVEDIPGETGSGV